MKRMTVLVLSLFLIFGVTVTSHATVLTFDDLTPTSSYLLIPDGYGGFFWDDMGYALGSSLPGSGYDNGVVSGDYVAFNWSAQVATVNDSLFDFNGAYLTGAWNDDLNITVKGFLAGAEQYSQTVVADLDAPTWFDFDFLGIDTLTFESFGGTLVPGLGGQGVHFAMDNFTFNETNQVPEPATLLLVGAGLVGLAGVRRKSKK